MTSAHEINSVVAEYGMGTVEKLFRLFSISSLALRIHVFPTYSVADQDCL